MFVIPALFVTIIVCTLWILLQSSDITYYWELLADYNVWINNFILQFSFLGFITVICDMIPYIKKNKYINLFISYLVSTIIVTGINFTLRTDMNNLYIVVTLVGFVIFGILYFIIYFGRKNKFKKIKEKV